jgi:hypothetical protein
VATLWTHFQDGDVNKGLAELEAQAQRMIDDLLRQTLESMCSIESGNATSPA